MSLTVPSLNHPVSWSLPLLPAFSLFPVLVSALHVRGVPPVITPLPSTVPSVPELMALDQPLLRSTHPSCAVGRVEDAGCIGKM